MCACGGCRVASPPVPAEAWEPGLGGSTVHPGPYGHGGDAALFPFPISHPFLSKSKIRSPVMVAWLQIHKEPREATL